MRALLLPMAALATFGLVGCSSDSASVPSPAPTGTEGSPTAVLPSTTIRDSDLHPAAVAYLRAWAANDIATMRSNSAPGSPARAYARYRQEVFDSGRLDDGQAALEIRGDAATLTYGNGSSSRLRDLQADEAGLQSWTARPGGRLGERIVTGGTPVEVAGLRITPLHQYRNSEGDLRITLQVTDRALGRRDLSTPTYRSPDGRRSTAAAGIARRTGVVPVPTGRSSVALASAAQARPGGQLRITVFAPNGDVLGRTWMQLPTVS